MVKKVLKFGGTSVGTVERIQHVANIIKKEHTAGNKVIAVVSAMSGNTNELINLSKDISEDFNKRELDVLLSSGEQVTCALLAGALIGENFSFETAAKDNNDGGPPSGGEFIIAISPEKISGKGWDKHADEFFSKMSAMDGVRLPGERRHKNRLDKGPRNINEELVNKIKSLS
mgnify:CR=1 FL=1